MDLRREAKFFNRTVRRYQSTIGEAVVWYQYDITSAYHPVYNEGPDRKWLAPIVVPVMHVVEIEDSERDTPEGRQPTQRISFDLLAQTAQQVGFVDPRSSAPHLNDIVAYDGRYYELRVYQDQGRMRQDLIVHVEGVEVFLSEEYNFDTFPSTWEGNVLGSSERSTTSSEDLV